MHVLVSVRAAVCVIVAGAVSVTHAQDSPDIPVRSQPVEDPFVSEALSLVGQCHARPINRVYVPRVGGQFQVAVSRGKIAYVHFPEWVKLENAIFEHRVFRVDQLGNDLSVSPGMGLTNGGYWMDTGDPVVVRGIEGTTMTGLGVRLSKGLASLLAFEGELVGARSGEVTFANVTWNEHWLLGAGATFAGTFYTGARSLEVGLHAGYRWSLEGEDGSLIER